MTMPRRAIGVGRGGAALPFVAVAVFALGSSAAGASAQGGFAALPACAGVVGLDADADGVDDACELAAARAFAPVLVAHPVACDAEPDPDSPARLRGGYHFAAERIGDALRLAYLLAYRDDCGWSGPKCALPFIHCAPHAGDSEIIVVDARAGDDGLWRAAAVFLSGHCFRASPVTCRWFQADELERFAWDGGPIVWVAEGRHANYASWHECDSGHRYLDTCDRHDVRFRFPVEAHANIGSAARPLPAPCVSWPASPDTAAVECFWDEERPFRGWQPNAPGVTPYGRYLRDAAGFIRATRRRGTGR